MGLDLSVLDDDVEPFPNLEVERNYEGALLGVPCGP